ncbi:PAAR domain-containing protein [Sphingobacterium daejeonense]|uniref:PAAR domain-containing protein n=1 Tax=Sphingobacterium daejeonense TaxID=371142 RepID=UPI0010C272A3|nr:PAAR domain-containing protein [Sphingobacterium daejeonense]VTP99707.1 Uncharacterized conserved protein [Sphingobacterium daejeonense]
MLVGPVLGPGVPTVLIGGNPAAVVGDLLMCTGPPDSIAQGSMTVMIGGKPAARQGDITAHGGTIVNGNANCIDRRLIKEIMEKSNINFLGTGWAFPPEFNKTSNTVEMVSAVEDIDQSLNILLVNFFRRKSHATTIRL